MTGAALDLLASLVLDDDRRWGDAAEPWQWDDARAVLEGSQRLAYITRPRGASKTTDLAGIGIATLLEQLPPASRSYAVAADRDQAALLVDAMAGFVTRTPGLPLQVDAWKATATRTGATLEVLAADAAGAFGKLPHLIVVDERAQWKTTPEPERLWRALFSALPKVAGSRLVVLTTAGDPAHPAGKLIKRARASSRWYVSELPGPCPWADASDLAEQREELPEWEYRRLHLNQWVASADRLTTVEDLEACVTLDGPLPFRRELEGRYAIGVDLATKDDRSVVVVCHVETINPAPPLPLREMLGLPSQVDESVAREYADRLRAAGVSVEAPAPPVAEQRVVLDRMGAWQGSRANPLNLQVVEDFVAEVSQRYGSPLVLFDPFQGVGMMQRLQGRGVRVQEVTFTPAVVGRLGLVLHQLIRSHRLAIPDDPELIDELANVRLRETSAGTLRMDHDHGRHDDRAIAIALAARHLLDMPASSGRPAVVRSFADPMDAYDRQMDAWVARRLPTGPGGGLLDVGL